MKYNYLYNLNIKHFIDIRLHLGTTKKTLNIKNTPYLFGYRHNITIFSIEKMWHTFRYTFFNFVELFALRNTFLIINTENRNIKIHDFVMKFLNSYPFVHHNFKNIYVNGYVENKWIGGSLSNWKIIIELLNHIKKLSHEKQNSTRYLKYLYYLKGLKDIKSAKIYPDFLFMLSDNKLALQEASNLNIPAFGIIDSNMNPDFFLYKIFGNNKSKDAVLFFLMFLKEAILEGRFKEQQQFIDLITYYVKKNILN